MLPLQASVDLVVMPMKAYSAFLKASASNCLVSYPGHLFGGGLPLYSDAVRVFYSPSQLGNDIVLSNYFYLIISYGQFKSDLTDKMKRSFFQAAVVSILLYRCTTWMLTKRLEKKLDGNYTRILRAILNKSWRQHPTRHQLYGHLPPITKTIQVRRTRHAGHCWRSKDKLISDVLLWTPTYGRAKAGRPARTYIQQRCKDMGCSHEDLPEAMNDREKWRERVRDIRASGTIWWWWKFTIDAIFLRDWECLLDTLRHVRRQSQKSFNSLFCLCYTGHWYNG